jgi:hypothetical protein
MANEIQLQSATGRTVYAVIFRDSDQSVYNGSGFESLDGDNWGDYDVALTEVGTTGIYRADFPVAITVTYSVMMYWQQAGSPATSDVLIGIQAIGKNAVTLDAADVSGNLPANVTQWRGTQPGTLDANNFVPVNTAAVNGSTARADTLSTWIDNNRLDVAISVIDGKLNTIDGIVDEILIDTGTILPGELDTIETKIDTIDLVVDAVKLVTDQFVFSTPGQVDANAISGGGGLDANGVRNAIGLAAANLDTQLSTIDNVADGIKTKTDQLTFTIANQVDANALSGGGGGGSLTEEQANQLATVYARVLAGDVQARALLLEDGLHLVTIKGDDYTIDDVADPIEWRDPGGNWPDLEDATLVFTSRNRQTLALEATQEAELFTYQDGDDELQGVRLELPRSQTINLTPGTKSNIFDVEAQWENGKRKTIVRGNHTVLQDVTRTPNE